MTETPSQPSFPMTVVGHGRVHHAHLPAESQRRLHELTGICPAEWGLLFVLDGRGCRWTLYSSDPEYTVLFAPAAHILAVEPDVFTTKFPCWDTGWQIS
jgi:hypothetical protein